MGEDQGMDTPQLCTGLAACLPDTAALGLLVVREYTTGGDIQYLLIDRSSLFNSLIYFLFLILVQCN